jgi:hypothetical protein
VLNVTRQYYLTRQQAEEAIENCAALWVEPGAILRDVTPEEARVLRMRQSALCKLNSQERT